MKKLFSKITTGSPIIDGLIIIVITAFLGFLLRIKFNFKLLEFLLFPFKIPLGFMVVFLSLSLIFIKRLCFNLPYESKLGHLLINRKYRLIYNPKDGRSKEIGFGKYGKITEGQNDNEYSWHISSKRLEIFGADGKIYSRFRYDKDRQQFLHTNDSDTRSIQNQVIEPIQAGIIDWAKQKKNF
ncbi:MAG: hypothetical protein M0R20_00080 [Candidatus Omnitrophica bacterium]|nr:hypothetical protein [Candidatus Omnitrophota bacterium]